MHTYTYKAVLHYDDNYVCKLRMCGKPKFGSVSKKRTVQNFHISSDGFPIKTA